MFSNKTNRGGEKEAFVLYTRKHMVLTIPLENITGMSSRSLVAQNMEMYVGYFLQGRKNKILNLRK